MPVKADERDSYKYISLVYLGFFFLHFFFAATPPTWQIIVNGVAICIFLVIYFWSFKLKGIKKMIPASIMVAFGLGLAPINTSANAFFPYAAYLATQALKPKHCYIFLATILVGAALVSWIFDLHFSYLIITTLITVAVMLGGITDNKIVAANEQLKRSQEEVEQLATLAERERIARDLHDLLGHTLSVIILKAELLNKLLSTQAEKARQESSDIESIARDALKQIRLTINNYRHTSFQEELKSVSQTLENSDIGIEKNINLPKIPIKYETPLCMILKEAVTNIIRHTKATLCQISLTSRNDCIELCIADNGQGSSIKEGNGIRGIRERVSYLNGKVEFQQEQGTKLTVTLPSV